MENAVTSSRPQNPVVSSRPNNVVTTKETTQKVVTYHKNFNILGIVLISVLVIAVIGVVVYKKIKK